MAVNKVIRRGVMSKAAKLTDEKVRQIRQSKETAAALSRRYGVSMTVIGRIRRREAWSHIP